MRTWIYTREDDEQPQPQVILFPSYEDMITRFIDDLIRDGREALTPPLGAKAHERPLTIAKLTALRDEKAPLPQVFAYAQELHEQVIDDLGGFPFYHLDDEGGTEVPAPNGSTPELPHFYDEAAVAFAEEAHMYRMAAKREYAEQGSIEIEDLAPVSKGEDGAYVQAWVFVPHPNTDQPC